MLSTDMLMRLIVAASDIEDRCLAAAKDASEVKFVLQNELSAFRTDAKLSLDPFPSGHGVPKPVVDMDARIIRWCGRSCDLGHSTLFRLFERLARHPNAHVSYAKLLEDVWGGSKSDETIRSAVRHLKRRLERAGMKALADAIHASCRHYVLRLDPAE
jgi:hypothetical protein